MEVHTQTHTSRKKWTHYFWEFFMLFLAVFCGFIAENQREHYIEHQREKKYMVSLLNNLEADSIMLSVYSVSVKKQIAGLDTLIAALRHSLLEKEALAYVYVLYMKYALQIINVHFNENTIVQLKNAGGFRLIRKDKVVDVLNSYEYIKSIVIKDKDETSKLIMDLERNWANTIFDFTNSTAVLKLVEVSSFGINNTDSLVNIVKQDSLVLIDKTPGRISAFRNNLQSLKSLDLDYGKWIDLCNKKNSELRTLIKKEYRLK
jgi:hypothetical protein